MITDYGIAGDFVSRTFRLRANDQAVQVVETPPMTATERQALADAYRKLPDYCHIYDAACMHLHYAHFAADGAVTVEVDAGEPVRAVRIHPERRKVAPEIRGATVTFSLGSVEPRYFVVRINELPPLMVIVDPPETSPVHPDDRNVIDAAAFLVAAEGESDHTDALQRAFSAGHGTGKTVLIPRGTYRVKQLHVRDGRNFRIHLAAGCLIQVLPSRHGENEHRHGLWLQDCEDVAIEGRGCIDHQAYEHYVLGGNNYQDGMVDYYTPTAGCPWITQSPIFMTGSKRIRIEGITLRNGRNFNLNVRNCDDVTIRRLKILTPPACTPEYADGINSGSSQRVLVENCLVASNDDCFASGHYFSNYDTRGSADHVVRGLVGWTMRGSGSRLGFYAGYDQGDFTYERCDFSAMVHASFLIHALRPKPDGQLARYGTVRITDCGFDDTQRLSLLLSVEKAAIDRLILDHVTFLGPLRSDAKFHVEGTDGSPIGELVLRNVTVDGTAITSLAQLPTQIANVARVTIS